MKRRRALLLFLTIMLALCAACGVWLHRERQQYNLNRLLIDALEHEDTKTALALVNAGANPNTCLAPTPAPSLKLLLNQLLHHRALPDDTSPTAFLYACGAFSLTSPDGNMTVGGMDENLPLLRAMLAHGANVHATAYSHSTALHFAAADNRLHTAELLLQHGADVNAQDDAHYTPLLMVMPVPSANVLHLLLSHGANPNVQRADGSTLLHQAVFWPDANAVVELLADGANPDIKNQNGDTPLQLAQQMNRPDLVRLLKQHGTK